ncbi:hypothetical protein EV1_002796 [Malus domestica]|uniref:Uncharacterized protein n=1 Tax=Malus domestica TaxID=3750 RepID=A0A498IY76_MALDO|nr:hypothetical protein DVH24_042470 [Malus domestica]
MFVATSIKYEGTKLQRIKTTTSPSPLFRCSPNVSSQSKNESPQGSPVRPFTKLPEIGAVRQRKCSSHLGLCDCYKERQQLYEDATRRCVAPIE